MNIEKIEKLEKDTWFVETKDKAIAYCGISAERFIKELISISNQPERSKRDDCTLCETVTMNENGEDYLVRMRCSEHSGN